MDEVKIYKNTIMLSENLAHLNSYKKLLFIVVRNHKIRLNMYLNKNKKKIFKYSKQIFLPFFFFYYFILFNNDEHVAINLLVVF